MLLIRVNILETEYVITVPSTASTRLAITCLAFPHFAMFPEYKKKQPLNADPNCHISASVTQKKKTTIATHTKNHTIYTFCVIIYIGIKPVINRLTYLYICLVLLGFVWCVSTMIKQNTLCLCLCGFAVVLVAYDEERELTIHLITITAVVEGTQRQKLLCEC